MVQVVTPSSTREAIDIVRNSDGDAKYLAGGTALVLLVKMRMVNPELLVSLRGELGEFNPAQLHMGRAVPGCLDALTIRHVTLRTQTDMETIVAGAVKTCFTAEEPFGILLSAQLTGWKPEN